MTNYKIQMNQVMTNHDNINSKSQIRNSKQITNSKSQCSKPAVWNLENWNLEFVWDLDIGI
jgi:hypothetical protein